MVRSAVGWFAVCLSPLFGRALADGSFVHFESGHVRPLALSADGALLFAVNTPDNRLEIFSPQDASLRRRGEVMVGLEPVAVAVASASEVWVVNHLSDSVSVVDVSDPDRPWVKSTRLVGDEPRDVVIGGPGRTRIFVTAAHRGQNRPGDAQLTTPGVGRADVWIFDTSIPRAPPRILTLFCDTPRGLAVSPDGRRVYAAAFHSGNKTTVVNELAIDPFWFFLIGDGFIPPGPAPPFTSADGTTAPLTSLITRWVGGRWLDALGRDWSRRVRFDLSDCDVFVIDAESDPSEVVDSVTGVGTTLFNLAVHPVDGRVFVSNLESRNFVRFAPEVRGHPVENRITIIEEGRARPVHLNPHVDYRQPHGSPEEIEASLALPTGMEFGAEGQLLYLAVFGSSQVAVLDDEAGVVDRIDVGGGPSGLVLHEEAAKLYVMNRLDHAIAIVDLPSRRVLDTVALRYNPEPVAIRDGRRFFYDAREASAHGDAACGSCHIFGDSDDLAWDFGNPHGVVTDNPLVRVPEQGDEPLRSFHPLMGPMTTRSLRGLAGAGPMHWRGDLNGGTENPFDERAAFLKAREAFHGLLGRRGSFPPEQMEQLADFVLEMRYPPNPIARLDGSLTPAQAAGREIFASDGDRFGLGGAGISCTACHVLPLGTDGHGVTGRQQDFKVAHLRNLYQRIGMFGYASPGIVGYSPVTLEERPTPHRGDQVRGFGFRHDGSIPTISDHLREPLEAFHFPDEPNRSGVEKVLQVEAFLLTFPTGLAPVVGQQTTLGGDEEQRVPLQRLALFMDRARAGDGDLVGRGLVEWEMRGLVYAPAAGGGDRFRSDRSTESFTIDELKQAASAGNAVLTFTVVPPGCGQRIGRDRDEDGALDRDELDRGFDPADPDSRPEPSGALLWRGDCDADGRLDLSDAVFSLAHLFLGGLRPDCPFACDANTDGNFDVSDPLFTLNFLFLGGSAPGAYPACELAPESCRERCPHVGEI